MIGHPEETWNRAIAHSPQNQNRLGTKGAGEEDEPTSDFFGSPRSPGGRKTHGGDVPAFGSPKSPEGITTHGNFGANARTREKVEKNANQLSQISAQLSDLKEMVAMTQKNVASQNMNGNGKERTHTKTNFLFTSERTGSI